ncbi:MAG: aminotransferase class V-fold PLP-dependent enzyme, partial [Bacteroidota bacterium]
MLEAQSHLFDLDPEVCYLNCAYMSPLMKSVSDAGHEGVERKRRPWAVFPEHFFDQSERVRDLFAQLINVKESRRIAHIPSVSYGLAAVAQNIPFKAGQEIVLTGEQFPSNVYIWDRMARLLDLKLVFVDAPHQKEGRAAEWNARILDAINEQTALVAMGHVHWADGTRFDLGEIRERSDAFGAYLVIDGTQSIGAYPFDVDKIRPDALIAAAYKWMMGPYASGFAYFGPRFDRGIPLEENWLNRKGSTDFSGLVDYEPDYQPYAGRYEMGERSNFINLAMLEAALSKVVEWTPAGIQEYTGRITQDGIATLQHHGYWLERPEYRGNHLVGMRLPEGQN